MSSDPKPYGLAAQILHEAPPENVVYSKGKDVQMNIKPEDFGTIDEFVEEAVALNAEVKKSGIPPTDHEGVDKLFKELREKHKKFAQTFPIVFKWTVQRQEFRPRAVRKYFEKVQAQGGHWNTREDFVDSQADYLVLLNKEIKGSRWRDGEIKRYRKAMVDMLRQEDKEFMKMHEEAKNELKDIERRADAERRAQLVAAARRIKAEREAAAKNNDV